MKGKFSDSPSAFEASLKPIVRGIIVGIVVIAILFVLFALVMSFNILPISAATVVSSIAIAAGSFLSGFFSAKKLTKNGLIIGTICGFLLFILFTIIGIAAFGSAPGASTLIRLLIFVTSGAIGGIIGVGNTNKRKIV